MGMSCFSLYELFEINNLFWLDFLPRIFCKKIQLNFDSMVLSNKLYVGIMNDYARENILVPDDSRLVCQRP